MRTFKNQTLRWKMFQLTFIWREKKQKKTRFIDDKTTAWRLFIWCSFILYSYDSFAYISISSLFNRHCQKTIKIGNVGYWLMEPIILFFHYVFCGSIMYIKPMTVNCLNGWIFFSHTIFQYLQSKRAFFWIKTKSIYWWTIFHFSLHDSDDIGSVHWNWCGKQENR